MKRLKFKSLIRKLSRGPEVKSYTIRLTGWVYSNTKGEPLFPLYGGEFYQGTEV